MKKSAFALTAFLAVIFTACEKKPAVTAASPAPSTTTPAAADAPAPAVAVPAPAADPKVAFTTALNAMADEVYALEKKYKDTNPMELMKQLPGLLKKLETVPTAGLPEDLAAAYTRVQKNASATGDMIAAIPADLPDDPDKIQAYLQANPGVMKVMMEMDAKMAPLKEEGEVAKKELEAAAAKHGLDLSRFIKAGEHKAGG
jgi:hypothetical protein